MTHQRKIRVDQKIWDAWRLAFYDTNYEELMEITGLAKPTIADAILRGIASIDTMEKLNEAFLIIKSRKNTKVA